ncbi:hypothetical protein BH23ACT3_BH23ACT3_15120 [soil metagenome]
MGDDVVTGAPPRSVPLESCSAGTPSRHTLSATAAFDRARASNDATVDSNVTGNVGTDVVVVVVVVDVLVVVVVLVDGGVVVLADGGVVVLVVVVLAVVVVVVAVVIGAPVVVGVVEATGRPSIATSAAHAEVASANTTARVAAVREDRSPAAISAGNRIRGRLLRARGGGTVAHRPDIEATAVRIAVVIAELDAP